MQDRYAGDIGDYGKIGLLRALQSQGMSIAVNWYLVAPPVAEKRADGKYLIPERLKVCDEALAEMLTGIARGDRRSVQALEQADFVPGAVYFSESVPVDGRTEWHSKAMQALKSADLVFVDPDNGMLAKSVGKKSVRSIKYVFYEEVRDYVGRGQSVLIYNHRSRKQEAQYFHEICSELQKATDVLGTEILKITFPKYSVRDYLGVSASAEHREKIEAAFISMEQSIWGKTGMCRIPREDVRNGSDPGGPSALCCGRL